MKRKVVGLTYLGCAVYKLLGQDDGNSGRLDVGSGVLGGRDCGKHWVETIVDLRPRIRQVSFRSSYIDLRV